MVGVLVVVTLAVVVLSAAMLWGAATLGRIRKCQAEEFSLAKRLFRMRREYLEARFVTLAPRTTAVQDFLWGDCDFDDDVAFARDRGTGELRALVGVTIFFEPANEHELDAIGSAGRAKSVLAATAVFRFVEHDWMSDGRAIFNLDPGETIRRFGHELEAVE